MTLDAETLFQVLLQSGSDMALNPNSNMSKSLDAHEVRLMTNNPKKVAALEAAGITVSERVPHQLADNPHNARYLDTKRDRTGHIL